MGQSTEELTTQIEQTRRNLSQDVDELNDKVNPSRVVERRKEAARSRLGGLRDKVMGTASQARDHASSATDSVSGTASSATGSAHDALGSLEQRAEGNPLAAGLVAFGAGLLVSSLIPASDKESRAAQQVVETAKQSGVVDQARSVGQDVGEQLKGAATDAAQEVRATAEESAGHVRDEGRSSAETVKEDARQSG